MLYDCTLMEKKKKNKKNHCVKHAEKHVKDFRYYLLRENSCHWVSIC